MRPYPGHGEAGGAGGAGGAPAWPGGYGSGCGAGSLKGASPARHARPVTLPSHLIAHFFQGWEGMTGLTATAGSQSASADGDFKQ